MFTSRTYGGIGAATLSLVNIWRGGGGHIVGRRLYGAVWRGLGAQEGES